MLRRTIMSAVLIGAASVMLAGCWPFAGGMGGGVKVDAPTSNARVTSPMSVEGVAPGDWYFEAVFPMELKVDGKVIAEAPARAMTDWQTPGPKRFTGWMAFSVTEETQAMLVLSEDMPGEGKTPRTVEIPVVLTPGPGFPAPS